MHLVQSIQQSIPMSINFSHIEQAHARIKPHIHRTPIMQSQEINKLLGCELYFKAENLQKVGAFKACGNSDCFSSKLLGIFTCPPIKVEICPVFKSFKTSRLDRIKKPP